jgi:peptidoglycan hydrolase-like protein with peptidoglycan-binding domain
MGRVGLFVVHIMQGTLDGTDGWFHDPAAQVSAHFGVGKDGRVFQWVDTDAIAYAEAAYNDAAISIEHEGNSGETLTPVQLAASLTLLRWLHEKYPEVPLRRQLTVRPGVVGHGMLGVAGGNHPDCPGDPILAQFTAALNVPVAPPVVVGGIPRPEGPLPTLYWHIGGHEPWVQFLHACLKMPLPRRGGFGAITRRRVLAVQTAHGGPADGVVGPVTWGWLRQR